METARIMAGAFLVFFVASALLYWIARRVCAFFSPRLDEIIRKQSWPHSVLVAATSAAILLMLCLATASNRFEAAKRIRTANEAGEIQTAILGFYTEYSEMPPATDNATLIEILTGNDPRYNSRGIAFISLAPRDVNDQGEMVDAWQQPFHISFADPNHLTITSDTMPSNFKIEVTRPDD